MEPSLPRASCLGLPSVRHRWGLVPRTPASRDQLILLAATRPPRVAPWGARAPPHASASPGVLWALASGAWRMAAIPPRHSLNTRRTECRSEIRTGLISRSAPESPRLRGSLARGRDTHSCGRGGGHLVCRSFILPSFQNFLTSAPRTYIPSRALPPRPASPAGNRPTGAGPAGRLACGCHAATAGTTGTAAPPAPALPPAAPRTCASGCHGSVGSPPHPATRTKNLARFLSGTGIPRRAAPPLPRRHRTARLLPRGFESPARSEETDLLLVPPRRSPVAWC